jgi:hypothetical protein
MEAVDHGGQQISRERANTGCRSRCAARRWAGPEHTTRRQEQRICQSDEREPPHVAQIDAMRDDAEYAEPEGETVDDAQHDLQHHYSIY